MKKTALFIFIFVCLLSVVLSVSAYDQAGDKRWCNSDADGCWVTGEEGAKIYIMFWSEASRDRIMGPGSNAPLGLPMPAGKVYMPGTPKVAGSAESSASGECVSMEEWSMCVYEKMESGELPVEVFPECEALLKEDTIGEQTEEEKSVNERKWRCCDFHKALPTRISACGTPCELPISGVDYNTCTW